MRKDQIRQIAISGRTIKRTWSVVGWGDNVGLMLIKGGFHRERDARNFMLSRQDELGIRFGIRLFTMIERD